MGYKDVCSIKGASEDGRRKDSYNTRMKLLSATKPNWLLGFLAVTHSALLLIVPATTGDAWLGWSNRLWVGLATLWFFWPPILALHRTASCA